MDGITGKGKGQQPGVSSGMLLDELDYKIKELLENKRKENKAPESFHVWPWLFFTYMFSHCTCYHTAIQISQYADVLSLPKMGEVQKPSHPAMWDGAEGIHHLNRQSNQDK